MAAVPVVCLITFAHASDPNRMLSQYVRTSWGIEKGFPGGSVSSIAQTPDGYLWIGTDKGLIRFDGLNFRKFEQANSASLPIGPVHALQADAQGNLWILLQNTKLLRYHDGMFDLVRGDAENGVTAMARGTGDALLLSSLALGTLRYNGERFVSISSGQELAASHSTAGAPDELSTHLSWSSGLKPHLLAAPNSVVTAIAATGDGKIWLGTEDRGLSSLIDGQVSPAANSLSGSRISCLLPLERTALWIGTSKGMFGWNGNELTRAAVPSALLHGEILSMIRDRDANIWVGMTRGLARVNASGISFLTGEGSASSGPFTALFEDREGNIWIGGLRSLERLRDSAFATYSVPSLKSQSMGPVYVDSDGQTWFGPVEGGLWYLKGQKAKSVTAAGLANDIVYSITGEHKNDVWVGRQQGGLTHLSYTHGTLEAKTYTKADGLAQNSVFAVHESRDGTVWAGTLSGGLSQLRNGHFTNYTTANGLASNMVSAIAASSDGTIWLGTPKGLTAMTNSGWRTYTSGDGLPSEDINCLLVDSGGILWIGTAAGLASLTAGHVQVLPRGPDLLHEPIFGMAEDGSGWLWVATADHVLQVKRASLAAGQLGDSDLREYGLADGLHGTEGVKRQRSVVEDSEGRIWFSTNRGLSVVNPAREAANPIPALVHVEAVLANGNPFDLRGPIRVPAGQERTTFRFTGLTLANSERVRYRYRLDGFDKGWSEPTATPEASYANLRAGSYKFHVQASNSDGLWSGSEASVGFAVEPTLWETWWFRLALVFCIGLAILAVYRLRMHQLTRLLNVRFDERLNERTRIAQDLHDTLLQGVVSASMQLHVAVDQLPEDSPARPALNRVLQLIGQVISEGRNTLRGLRLSYKNVQDLKNSFSQIPEELGNNQDIDFRVIVEGMSMPLRSVIRDDVYCIGREAVVNAFRHSQARSIAVQLEYAPSQLRILVRDDGCGIDPQVLKSGRDGHWGMSGMRERAERIGAKLKVLSRAGAGTEVELRVPGNIAFDRHFSSLASK